MLKVVSPLKSFVTGVKISHPCGILQQGKRQFVARACVSTERDEHFFVQFGDSLLPPEAILFA